MRIALGDLVVAALVGGEGPGAAGEVVDHDALLAADGAALVAAHAGAHLLPPVAVAGGSLPLGKGGVEARPEQRHGALLVLVLRALGLAADREARRPVGE